MGCEIQQYPVLRKSCFVFREEDFSSPLNTSYMEKTAIKVRAF